jgi:4-hydroxy-tetrahydrodipicolinate synthase
MISRLEGVGVALVTPFDKSGEVDYTSLKKLLNYVSDNQVDYLVVNGTTGESATTDKQEKLKLLSFVKKENSKKLPVVFGLGGNNTREIIKLANEIDFDGVDAILSVSPYYNKPSQEGIYQHYKALAEESPKPIILYNVPGRTGANMTAETTLRLSEIPNIIGIKEASGNILQALEISKHKRKDFLLISGDDLLTLPLISIGARGVISVLANAFPEKFSTMVKLALNSEFGKATEILKKFTNLNPCIYEEGNPVGIKLTLEMLDVCSCEVRLPLVRGSEQLKLKIAKCLPELA